jgi:hypothetical protein
VKLWSAMSMTLPNGWIAARSVSSIHADTLGDLRVSPFFRSFFSDTSYYSSCGSINMQRAPRHLTDTSYYSSCGSIKVSPRTNKLLRLPTNC